MVKTQPWLVTDTEEADGQTAEVMYCHLCTRHQTSGLNGSAVWTLQGCRTLRLDKVISHEQTEHHQFAVKLETEVQVSIDKAFTEKPPLNEESETVVCATKLLHFHIKHNIPQTTVYEVLIDFSIEELKSPLLAHLKQGKNASYKNQTITDELLAAMTADIEETLQHRVRSSHTYSVMTDEAIDIANHKHFFAL